MNVSAGVGYVYN